MLGMQRDAPRPALAARQPPAKLQQQPASGEQQAFGIVNRGWKLEPAAELGWRNKYRLGVGALPSGAIEFVEQFDAEASGQPCSRQLH